MQNHNHGLTKVRINLPVDSPMHDFLFDGYTVFTAVIIYEIFKIK